MLMSPCQRKKQKKRKRTQVESSKLWHCCLGHISRGRIERLVKNEILPPLEFSDLEQCIECIKGKFVKQIKKGAKRSAGTLEIIHTYICGPFPVRSGDGCDSFITFTDDYSYFGYIYPIKKNQRHWINLRYSKLKMKINMIKKLE